MNIGKLKVGESSPPIFIAEAAVEHLGSIQVAMRMADAAKSAGAHVIKFQMHFPEHEMVPNVIKFWGGSLDNILEMYNLTVADHNTLIEYCEEIGIQYLCTPFCRHAVDVLEDLGVVAFKTGSGELTNSIMMERIIDIGKPLIMSTGMCAIEELDDVVKTIKRAELDLVIMNCTSIYPAPYSKINLNLIPLYQQRYDVFVGHSDHTPDIWTSIAAVALGACVVEKHFTLNRSMRGPDYQVSLEPSEFMQMVEGANKVFEARGQDKLIHDEEVAVREWAHHSLVAKTNISKGEKILSTSLEVKRPGTGIPAKFIDKLESHSAREQIPAGATIKWEHLCQDNN